jgi:hypothetical protein
MLYDRIYHMTTIVAVGLYDLLGKMFVMVRITTIQVKETTREKLKDLGRKGETYDQIIEKLLQIYQKKTIPK